MSKLTNAEDRIRASLQDVFGLGGAGFDLLLLARHMMDMAARPGNLVEDATRGSRHGKATAFSGHVDNGDAASAVARGFDHSNGAVAVANEVRKAAFRKIAASALQTSEAQISSYILNAFSQLEKPPTEWVCGSSKIKNESATAFLNEYAPQPSEIVQPHDCSMMVPATQPVPADHDDRSMVSAFSASDSRAPAGHRLNSGDAEHNAASNDLSGGRPDLTSISGSTRSLLAASASRTTVALDHAFQSTGRFHSNETASAQFSDSSRGSADTDGAGPGRLSAVPALHGENGFGSILGRSFGTDAMQQHMTVGGALSIVTDNFTLPSIQPSVVSLDSTSLLADLIESLPQTHVLMQGPPIEGAGHLHGEDVSYHRTADVAYVSPASNQQRPEVDALRACFGYLLGVNGFDTFPAAPPLDSLGSDPANHVAHELTLDHSTPPPLPGLADFHYDYPILDPGLGPDVHVDVQLWHSH